MNTNETSPRRFPAILLALLAASACGGGGGGGDEGTSASFETDTGRLTYQFGTFNADLVASGAESLAMDLLYDGTYDLGDDRYAFYTQLPFTVDTGSTFGELDVDVAQPIMLAAGDRPDAGELHVVQVSSGMQVEIAFLDAPARVAITLDAGQASVGPREYEWDTFEALAAAGTLDEFERIADAALRSLTISLNHFLVTLEAFEHAFVLADELEAAGPGVAIDVPGGCQTFPGTGQEGSLAIGWIDLDGDGAITDGDEIALLFQDCWTDRAAGTDSIYSGTIQLTETYANEEPFSTQATVLFAGFSETRTREVGGVHEVVPGGDVVTSGRFSASFYDVDG